VENVPSSVPTRSIRNILVFIFVGLAIQIVIGMGSKWLGYSAGFSFLAAALFTPALICFVLLPRQKTGTSGSE
jgi:hypothetical protein